MLLDRLTGNASRLPFDVILSLRSQFIHRPAPTILAIMAVAASVALAASVEIASRSVSIALERSMNAVAGSTQLEVTGAAQGVPEEMIEQIREIPGVRSASPIIQGNLRMVRPDGSEESLRILGLDLLYGDEVRDYGVAQGGLQVSDHVRLVASGDSIVLSRVLARRLGVGEGDRLKVRSSSGSHSVTVRGLLVGDLENAYGGALGVMDVFALQHLLGLERIVSRIDVSVAPGFEAGQIREVIQQAIGDAATVRHSTLRENVVTPILGAYRFGVWAITLIGVLLALFLTYAAISIVVDRRIVEFALLRAAGMDAGRASRTVIVDALILAGVGTILGLSIAMAGVGELVVFFSRASEFYQDLSVEPVPFSAMTVIVALAVGVPTALLACVEPARRAGRRRPLEVLYGRTEHGTTVSRISVLLVVGLIGVFGVCVALLDSGLGPGPRLAVVVAFGVASVWALSSALLPSALPKLQTVLASVVPRVGALVGASVGDRPVETGATVAVWAAVVAATFGLITSLNSLGLSMDQFFLGESGPTAIIAFTEDPSFTSPAMRLPIDLAVADEIERVPGVTGAWASRSTTVIFKDQEITIDDYDVDKLTSHGGLRAISDDSEASVAALRRGDLLASDAFRSRFGIGIGDTVELSTAEGPHTFRVGGGSRSFRGPNGKLALEAHEFSRWFRSRGADNIVLWVDGPVEPTLESVRRLVPDPPLFFREGDVVREQARRAIGRFSALLMLPLSVVGSIGLIGLTNLLVGNVAARRRDLALIHASGGTARNIIAVVALSASVVAVIGTVLGLLLGVCWALVIRDAITHFLGWRMALVADWELLGAIVAGAVVAASCAAIAPALLTSQQGSGPA